MILFELFWMFMLIGFVSFGGGYAMIPVIETEVVARGWLTTQEFTDVIAMAGMSPGPIATNSAVFVGYQVHQLPGALAAGLGMLFPSLLLVVAVATLFQKVSKNQYVKNGFYGLRPIIVGLIAYAALTFTISNQLLSSFSFFTGSLVLIFALSLFALMKLRIHPAIVIILSGVLGAALYS